MNMTKLKFWIVAIVIASIYGASVNAVAVPLVVIVASVLALLLPKRKKG